MLIRKSFSLFTNENETSKSKIKKKILSHAVVLTYPRKGKEYHTYKQLLNENTHKNINKYLQKHKLRQTLKTSHIWFERTS